MHSWQTRWSIGLTAGAVAFAVLAAPTAAHAAGTDIVVTKPAAESTPTAPVSPDVSVEQTAVKADVAPGKASVKRTRVDSFRMAGVTWDADSNASDVTVRVQVRAGGVWGDWQTLEMEENFDNGRPGTVPLWSETPADGIAVDVHAASGEPTGIKVTTIDPGKSEVVTPVSSAVYDRDSGAITASVSSDGTPTVVPMPNVITRAQWKAGPGTSCSAPLTRPKALGVVIHHTAGSNTYSKAESAGLVRSYQTYHVKGHGWCDIGYNFLVDRFGQIFEGRKGGMTKQVRAAHSGVDAVNQWASGVSMMGNFDYVQPSEALKSAVVRLVGWRLKYFGDNPKGTYVAGGKRYAVINGHRDVHATSCPGKYAYAWISAKGGLRDRVASYISKATSAAGSPSISYPVPTGIKLASSSPTSITAKWRAVSGATGYRVQLSSPGKKATYYRVRTNSATLTGLTGLATYRVRISVINPDTGARYSAYTSKPFPSVTTSNFAVPGGLKVRSSGSSTLAVSWSASSGAPGYRLLVTPTGTTSKATYLRVRTNAATVTGLKPGTRYWVRVAVANPTSGARLSSYTKSPYPSAVTSQAPASAPTTSAAKNTVSVGKTGSVSFTGHGYGHGIGMSQYGAEGGARAGAKYTTILKKYYPGTTIGSRTGSIRVLLSGDTTNSVYVLPRAGLKFRTLADNKVVTLPRKPSGRTVSAWSIDLAKKDARKNSLFYKSGTRWYLYKGLYSGSSQFEGPPTISLVMPSGSSVPYRGALRSVSSSSTTRDTLNVLSIEDYTRGVVAREMPSSWHPEALKSQAVAARTYGVRSITSSRYYDICDTTACQVYGGYPAEVATTNAAINATAGKVLMYGGAPAFTQFSSSSGGYTNVGSAPYLKAVKDDWDGWSGNANHTWKISVSAATIRRLYPTVGTVTSMTVTKRNGYGDQGGRVASLTIKGTKGSKTISGVDARWAFGLRSDWFGF